MMAVSKWCYASFLGLETTKRVSHLVLAHEVDGRVNASISQVIASQLNL
jgi:hypothetical protein